MGVWSKRRLSLNSGYELIYTELHKHRKKVVKGLEEKFFINWTATPNISKKQRLKRHDLKWQNSSSAVNKVSTRFPLCLLNSSAGLCLRLPRSRFPNCFISLNLWNENNNKSYLLLWNAAKVSSQVFVQRLPRWLWAQLKSLGTAEI